MTAHDTARRRLSTADLAHIAAAGWVHLDVKPSNVVLNVSPRLLDFELARPAAEAARMRWPAGTWA